MAESLQITSGTGSIIKLLNNGRTLTFDFFTTRSSLLPYAFVWEKCSELWLNLCINYWGREVYQRC